MYTHVYGCRVYTHAKFMYTRISVRICLGLNLGNHLILLGYAGEEEGPLWALGLFCTK